MSELDLQGHALASAHPPQVDGIAGLIRADGILEAGPAGGGRATDLDDDVARLQAVLRRRGAGVHLIHRHAALLR